MSHFVAFHYGFISISVMHFPLLLFNLTFILNPYFHTNTIVLPYVHRFLELLLTTSWTYTYTVQPQAIPYTHCFTPVRLTHNLEWSVPCPVIALWSSIALLTLSHHSFLESYSDLVSKYVYQFFLLRLFFSLLTSPATFNRATSLSILALDPLFNLVNLG